MLHKIYFRTENIYHLMKWTDICLEGITRKVLIVHNSNSISIKNNSNEYMFWKNI